MVDNGRVVDYEAHLESLFAPTLKILVSQFALKYVRFLVNFAYFVQKGYHVSPSYLVSFSEFFLLNLHWFEPLEAFFEFLYCFFQHFLHFLWRGLSSWRFITAYAKRWLHSCRYRLQILLSRSNTGICTRSNTRSRNDHSTSFIAKIFLFSKLHFVIFIGGPLKRIFILICKYF